MGRTEPEEVAAAIGSLMNGFGAPWCVAGGWALDLWLRRWTRVHADVELAVFRQDQALLHTHFPDWTFIARIDGRSEAWRPGNVLELPVHEIHARSPDGRTLEFLLNERDDTNWTLFKSKSPRDKDEADFHAAQAALRREQRLWLRSALLVCDPHHRWLDGLRT